MKKIGFMITMLLLCAGVKAESAKSILDKAAATVSNPNGVQANFQMRSKQFGNTSGSISIKGKKFHATTPQAVVWFDGKTQWTYMKQNDEVNVSTPNEQQLQVLNPYNFINLYKQGFDYTMSKTAQTFVVHLTAQDPQRRVQELFITVDKNSYAPTEVKMLQKQKWTTFTVSNLKTATLSDDLFRFNAKDFPTAEVIDLR